MLYRLVRPKWRFYIFKQKMSSFILHFLHLHLGLLHNAPLQPIALRHLGHTHFESVQRRPIHFLDLRVAELRLAIFFFDL